MAKQKEVEESATESETEESSEDVASGDSDSNVTDVSSREQIQDSGTSPLAEFRLSCLHDVNAEVLSSALQKYQEMRKGLDRDVVPQRSIASRISADFTPWWEAFTKSDHKSVITSVTEPKTDGDSYDNWFDKNSVAGSGWLCGPSPSASGTVPGQTSKVEDDVPSIYDSKPAPKGRRALKRERKVEKDKTLGKKWFGMKAPDVDEKLKNDMELIQMRSVLDPKRFYKHRDRKGLPKYFQMGTVVDEGTDFYSSRLTKKQRKQTLVEELMADANIRQYNKKKYAELQQKMRGKKTFKSKLKKH